MLNKTVNKGAALIIVLFISAVLGSIATLLIIKTKQHVERISIAKQFMQAERNLITDLNHLIFITQTTPYGIMGDNVLVPFDRTVLPDGINLQGTAFEYRTSLFSIQDMGGLICINPLDRDKLSRYLKHINWPEEQIYRFLDVLGDWQDPDGFQRINGAESSQYDVYGYPLNQPLQSVKELGLLENIDPLLLEALSRDNNLILFSAGKSTPSYAPDYLLPVFYGESESKNIQTIREKSREQQKKLNAANYSTGNWIIQVKTNYEEGKSSKILHLLRRFGERRPFVISRWQERVN